MWPCSSPRKGSPRSSTAGRRRSSATAGHDAALQNALEFNFNLLRVTDSSRSLPLRYLKLCWGLLARRQPVSAAVVGFYGQPLMLAARLLIRSPILFDAFLSTYETLVVERRIFKPGSPGARLALWLDQAACSAAGRVLLDTQADVDFFHAQLGVPREKLRRLFVGCDERLYYPRPELEPVPGRVLFWGTYLPLQGFDTVIRAAALLQDKPQISFRLIGGGREFPKIQGLARELGLNHVEFLPFRPEPELPEEIARAGVVLTGQFGNFDKSRRVIAGKTFQATEWDGRHKTHVDHRVVWVDPLNARHILSGNDGGVSESWDGGKHWS